MMKWKALLELADEVVKVPVGEQARADVRPIDEAKNLRRELRQKQQRHTEIYIFAVRRMIAFKSSRNLSFD